MKSTNLLLLLFLLTSSSVFAQKIDFSYKWGQEIRASKKSTLNDIIGYDDTGFYVIRQKTVRGLMSSNNYYSIEHFDNSLGAIKANDIALGYDNKERYIEFIVHSNNVLYLFSSYPDQKNKKNILFVQEINKNTLLPEEPLTKICEIDYEGNSKKNRGNFNFKLSRDNSKVLVFCNLPYEKTEPEKFALQVLDSDMKPLWYKEATLPYLDELFGVQSFKIDNDGNVYMLGTLFKDKRKTKRHGLPNYEYQLLTFTKEGQSFSKYSINLQEKFLTHMQIGILNSGDVICAGFYSEKGTVSIRGTYFLTLDSQTKEIKNKSLKEFSVDFITENMTERKAKKVAKSAEKGEEPELYEYDLDRLIVDEHGGAILVGEQYYVYTRTYSNGRSTYSVTYYNYNNIIVVRMNPNGSIEWARNIPKTQVSTNDGGFYSSYAFGVRRGKLYFIFNDNPKNLSYAGNGKIATYSPGRDGVVMVVEVDGAGNVKKQPVFASKDVNVITRPKVCKQVSPDEFILFGQRKKTQQFARLTFNGD